MLTLVLLRHAKSTWDEPDLDDHDRPLARRGATDAPRMGRWLGRWLSRHDRTLDLILCSDAVRTRATLALVLPELVPARRGGKIVKTAPRIETDPALYLCTPATILARITEAPTIAHTVMVVGHNPGLHMLALELTGDGDPDAISRLARGFPTAAAAILEFDKPSFAAVKPATGQLVALMSPKRL